MQYTHINILLNVYLLYVYVYVFVLYALRETIIFRLMCSHALTNPTLSLYHIHTFVYMHKPLYR